MAEQNALQSGRVSAKDILRITPKDERWRVDLRCGAFILVPFAVLGDQPPGVLFDMESTVMPRLCSEESRRGEHPCPLGPEFTKCLINVASP